VSANGRTAIKPSRSRDRAIVRFEDAALQQKGDAREALEHCEKTSSTIRRLGRHLSARVPKRLGQYLLEGRA
jgi:hypothetical protein